MKVASRFSYFTILVYDWVSFSDVTVVSICCDNFFKSLIDGVLEWFALDIRTHYYSQVIKIYFTYVFGTKRTLPNSNCARSHTSQSQCFKDVSMQSSNVQSFFGSPCGRVGSFCWMALVVKQ